MEKTTIAATMAVLVAILMVGSVLVPIIDIQSKETTTIINDGAGWARYDYYADDSTDYDVDMSVASSTLTLGTQSGTASEMIAWASDVGSIICSGSDFILLYDDNGTDAYVDLGASASVASASGTVTVTDSTDAAAATLTPAWAYVPAAAGSFGFFEEGGATVKDFPAAVMGSQSGLITYNSMSNAGGLEFESVIVDGILTGAEWSALEPGAAESIPNGTGSYTDGDWSFSIIDDNTANLTKYSGSTDQDIIVPSTVSDGTNTYSVVSMWSKNIAYNIFNSSTITTVTGSVVIPDSVTIIGHGCFKNVVFSGGFSMPNTITTIGNSGFTSCSFSDSELILPSCLASIGNNAFSGTGFSSDIDGTVIIPCDPTLATNAVKFSEYSDITVVYLGSKDLATYGLPSSITVHTTVPIAGYMAPVSFSETVQKEGAEYDLMAIIPVMVIAGIVMASAVMFGLMRRNY